MTRAVWWTGLGLFSIGILAIDIVTPRAIQFPIMFVLPVSVASWCLGRGAGIGFAAVLVGSRFGIAVALEQDLIPVWAAAVNAVIRLLVLVGMAVLIAAARERRLLARRVEMLEGILPICMVCKRIRQPDGGWEHIEAYVSQHSAAQFSHGLCEACGREHYGKYFRASGGPGATPDVGAA